LGVLFNGLYFNHLLIGFSGFSLDILFDNVGLLFVDGQAFEEFISFSGLFLKLWLKFGHFYFQLGHNLIGGIQFFQTISQSPPVGINLLFLLHQRQIKQFQLIQKGLWCCLNLPSFRHVILFAQSLH
jgi:hypothetical protein